MSPGRDSARAVVRGLLRAPLAILRTIGIASVWLGRALALIIDAVTRVPPLRPFRRWFDRAVRNTDVPPPDPRALVLLGSVTVLIAAMTVVRLVATSAPVAPMLPVDRLDHIRTPIFDNDRGVLFIGEAATGVQVLSTSRFSELLWCENSGHIESPDGAVWDERGRPLNGADPLLSYPVDIHDDTLYLDLLAPVTADPHPDDGVAAACSAP